MQFITKPNTSGKSKKIKKKIKHYILDNKNTDNYVDTEDITYKQNSVLIASFVFMV